jgi:hypothetical protein
LTSVISEIIIAILVRLDDQAAAGVLMMLVLYLKMVGPLSLRDSLQNSLHGFQKPRKTQGIFVAAFVALHERVTASCTATQSKPALGYYPSPVRGEILAADSRTVI